MRLRIIVPIITTTFNQEVMMEAAQFAAPDVELEAVNIRKGPASIESGFDEMLAAPAIVEEAVRAGAAPRGQCLGLHLSREGCCLEDLGFLAGKGIY